MTKIASDEVIQASIEKSVDELEKARESVHLLANELVNVVEIIEPSIAEQVKRLREARMTALSEMKQISDGLKELRLMLLAPEGTQMLDRCEKLLTMLRELEAFRACGALDAFAKAFATVSV